VLRRLFGPKRKEVVGGWRRWHNDELHNLHAYIITTTTTTTTVELRRMRLAGHVTHIRAEKCAQNFGQKA
jgi:hypothetical protein